MLPFLFLMTLGLTLLAFYSSLEDSFFQRYALEIHSFSTPYWKLGIFYDELMHDGYPVDCLVIGLLFINLSVETYKLTEKQRLESPELVEGLFSWKERMQALFRSKKEEA